MPATLATSKQLLPIYDKPMVFYPLTTLMLADIRDICLITTPQHQSSFQELIGDGSQWGLSIDYIVQPNPEGISQAYVLADDFLQGQPSCLILGDNLFFGADLPRHLKAANEREDATIFATHVKNPKDYGVVAFSEGKIETLVEKPANPESNFAVTGLYFLPANASERAKNLKKSSRGEYEITDLLNTYISDDNMSVEKLGRGFAWLDTGTHSALLDAGNFVRTLEDRQGLQVGSPDEIALRKQWIDKKVFQDRIQTYSNSAYGKYLQSISEQH